MRIVLDTLGGDNGPQAAIEGSLKALQTYGDFSLVLAGDEPCLREMLAGKEYDKQRVEFLHAPQCIGCEESPTMAIKQKKDSSLVKSLELVRDAGADCIVSAGSTGALLAGATLIIRRIQGVKRPALSPILPTVTGSRVMLIDCGANTDCRPSYLMQFGVMADAYMRHVLGVAEPCIGLLNNGTEAEKGNALTKAAYTLLAQAPLHFVGNCEARDILSGAFDAVVCDGFDGNLVLKNTEGMAAALMQMLKTELMADLRSKMGAMLARNAFIRLKAKMDYTEYGGAPLLGIKGCVIKAHGSSNAKAFCAALNQARSFVSSGVNAKIEAALALLPNIED